jgi:hypothetical protein
MAVAHCSTQTVTVRKHYLGNLGERIDVIFWRLWPHGALAFVVYRDVSTGTGQSLAEVALTTNMAALSLSRQVVRRRSSEITVSYYLPSATR